MATHTYFDFTLRTSFPKAGMHTLQKENRGVSVSQRQAKAVKTYMAEGNAACSRVLESESFNVIESATGLNGLGAIYSIVKDIATQNITGDTIVNYFKSVSDSIFPAFLIGDFVILSVNYFNIKSIYNKN